MDVGVVDGCVCVYGCMYSMRLGLHKRCLIYVKLMGLHIYICMFVCLFVCMCVCVCALYMC